MLSLWKYAASVRYRNLAEQSGEPRRFAGRVRRVQRTNFLRVLYGKHLFIVLYRRKWIVEVMQKSLPFLVLSGFPKPDSVIFKSHPANKK
jgi:hypothetical protein